MIRLAFWGLVCRHLLQMKSGFVHFSYDLKKKGLDNFYRSLGGDIIYSGPVKAIEGMPGDSEEAIVRLDLSEFSRNVDSLFAAKVAKALKG